MSTEEKIVEKLKRVHQTVAIAESCTGGMVCSRLVDVAGASDCFGEGYVTYSNEAKEKNLGVLHETLARWGAVSEETAVQMARGAMKRAGADYGVATTGIAGPGGGSFDKPVGLVYISCVTSKRSFVERHIFAGSRSEVRRQAADRALLLLEESIREEDAL